MSTANAIRPPAAVCWALGLFTFALGGCNQTTRSSAEDARYEAAQERQCAIENFRLEDYTVVNMADRDPAVRAALVHAGKIMERSGSEIRRKYCVFEKASVKNPERCFEFFLKVPTPGGGGMICIVNSQDISRVYLDE